MKSPKDYSKNISNFPIGTVFGVGGSILGGVAGVVLPAYLGWEIGDFIKNYRELGDITGYAVKSIGAIGLPILVAQYSIPYGVTCGSAVGGFFGSLAEKASGSLEKLISKVYKL